MEKFTDWWEDGAFNYVYTLSRREVKKIALGHGLPCFGYIGLADFYHPEWNSEPANSESEGFVQTKRQIELHSQFSAMTGIPQNYLIGMLFKETPEPAQFASLVTLSAHLELTRTRFLGLRI